MHLEQDIMEDPAQIFMNNMMFREMIRGYSHWSNSRHFPVVKGFDVIQLWLSVNWVSVPLFWQVEDRAGSAGRSGSGSGTRMVRSLGFCSAVLASTISSVSSCPYLIESTTFYARIQHTAGVSKLGNIFVFTPKLKEAHIYVIYYNQKKGENPSVLQPIVGPPCKKNKKEDSPLPHPHPATPTLTLTLMSSISAASSITQFNTCWQCCVTLFSWNVNRFIVPHFLQSAFARPGSAYAFQTDPFNKPAGESDILWQSALVYTARIVPAWP